MFQSGDDLILTDGGRAGEREPGLATDDVGGWRSMVIYDEETHCNERVGGSGRE